MNGPYNIIMLQKLSIYLLSKEMGIVVIPYNLQKIIGFIEI